MSRLEEIEARLERREREIDERLKRILGDDEIEPYNAARAPVRDVAQSPGPGVSPAAARHMRADGRRLAISIGLNTVDPAAYPGAVAPLTGCVIDVQRFACVLQRAAFETMTLIDEQATCANVYTALRRAAESLQAGDLFVCHVSSHGGRGTAPDGVVRESWCLYDGLAWDCDIVWVFSHFRPGVRILVINDQCHSGGIFQARAGGLDSPFARLATEDGRSKLWNAEEAMAKPDFPALIQFAGCRAEQFSMDGLAGGTWTQALINALDEACACEMPCSYRQWFDMAFASPTLRRGRQDPQWIETRGVTDAFRNAPALA